MRSAIWLALVLAGCECGRVDPGPQLAAAAACADDEATSRLVRDNALKAVDQSFQDHVEALFGVWMREETPDQQQRIQRGMGKAIKAYLQSRSAIERWPGVCR